VSAPALICVGGGRSQRFGGDKLAEPLGGRSVLATALMALRAAFPQSPLVVVVPPPLRAAWAERLGEELDRERGQLQVVAGGPRRQDSVRRGVEAALDRAARAGEDRPELAVVHDAARPLVDPGDVLRVVESIGDAAGVILCSKVTDTVKRVGPCARGDEGSVAGIAGGGVSVVVETLDRCELRLAQTPQVLRVDALLEAWRRGHAASSVELTDEAALLEAAGFEVRVVEACRPNPKITTRADLELVRALARQTG